MSHVIRVIYFFYKWFISTLIILVVVVVKVVNPRTLQMVLYDSFWVSAVCTRIHDTELISLCSHYVIFIIDISQTSLYLVDSIKPTLE